MKSSWQTVRRIQTNSFRFALNARIDKTIVKIELATDRFSMQNIRNNNRIINSTIDTPVDYWLLKTTQTENSKLVRLSSILICDSRSGIVA